MSSYPSGRAHSVPAPAPKSRLNFLLDGPAPTPSSQTPSLAQLSLSDPRRRPRSPQPFNSTLPDLPPTNAPPSALRARSADGSLQSQPSFPVPARPLYYPPPPAPARPPHRHQHHQWPPSPRDAVMADANHHHLHQGSHEQQHHHQYQPPLRMHSDGALPAHGGAAALHSATSPFATGTTPSPFGTPSATAHLPATPPGGPLPPMLREPSTSALSDAVVAERMPSGAFGASSCALPIPMPAARTQSTNTTASAGTSSRRGGAKTEAELRDKRELRRMKNRISAARSRQRKTDTFETLQRELGEARTVIETLTLQLENRGRTGPASIAVPQDLRRVVGRDFVSVDEIMDILRAYARHRCPAGQN